MGKSVLKESQKVSVPSIHNLYNLLPLSVDVTSMIKLNCMGKAKGFCRCNKGL
jgi:hypothetical protein